MLQSLSLRIRYCLEKAAAARKRAAESGNPARQQDYFFLEDRWRSLAHSRDFNERAERFLASQRCASEISQLVQAEPSGVGRDGARSAHNSGKQLIAIVDDDKGVCEALQTLIRAFGYATTSFATAEDYLLSDLMIQTGCLISDVQLPGMSGADLQVRLVAHGYRIPLIFLTGFFDESVKARVLRAGAVDYLAKPCKPEYLIGCIETVLNRVPV